MAQAKHALAAPALGRDVVTHARCTMDHTPGAAAYGFVAHNALLFWAVGLVPFKDGTRPRARE